MTQAGISLTGPTSQTTLKGDSMNVILWILLAIGIVLITVVIIGIVGVHKIQHLYDELDNVNPENWEEDNKEN